MKIGIDASFLRKPGTGIGEVTAHFLEKLGVTSVQGGPWKSWQFLSGLQEAQFILYTEAPTDIHLPENFSVRSFLPRWWQRDDVIRKWLWEKQVAGEAVKDGCDVFVSLYQSATVFPKYKIQNTQYGSFEHVMVVHDIIPKLFPEYLNKWTRRLHWKGIERGIRGAGHIIAISESTKKDITSQLRIASEKISVAYPGLSPVFDTVCTDEQLNEVLKKYDLLRGYIYHGGGLEIRKNVEKLLKAYKQLTLNSQQNTVIPKLVISGRIHAKGNPLATDVEKLVSELGLEERVKLLGFVPEGDLPALYRGAVMFVYPSFYEGLGLPPLEAMSQGTPVIVSNVSSLPEACGEAALYTDPKNVNELKEKMEMLLDDAPLRKALGEKGREQVKKFDWNKFVRAIMQ